MLKKHILLCRYPYGLLFQQLIVEQLAHLEADLRVFIRIERSDAGLGGAKRLPSKPLLFIGVELLMIGHHDLRPVRHKDLRFRHASVHNRLHFFEQDRYVQRYPVSDHARRMAVKYA